MQVVLVEADLDRHGAGCTCGLCDMNGHSWGIAVVRERDYFRYPDDDTVELERSYGPSDDAARHNAALWARNHGYVVGQPSETQQLLREEYCECDNTHTQNDTVCQFCYVRAHPDNLVALEQLYLHVAGWSAPVWTYTQAAYEALSHAERTALFKTSLSGARPYHTNYRLCEIIAAAQVGEDVPLAVLEELTGDTRTHVRWSLQTATLHPNVARWLASTEEPSR